jgi:hypothetical protein
MPNLDILLQGDDLPDVQFFSLGADADLAALFDAAAKFHPAIATGDWLVFVQDEDTPLKPGRLPRAAAGQPLSLHIHHCRKIDVAVSYNGETKSADLAPSRTVGAVKTLAAVKLFGMNRHDAAEHVLQLAGTTERPDADIHIGALARKCRVAFDLVPLVRVEG